MAESSIRPFENNYEKYRISTVGDGKVCSICSGMTGEFNITDRKPGINFPPFHPWCRCTFEIVVDDWDKWMDDYVTKHSKQTAEKISDDIIEKSKNRGIINSAGKSPFNNENLIYNPNAQYSINIDNYPIKICKRISEECKRIAELGYIDKKEHLALVNLNTGKTEYTEVGYQDSVGGTEFWKFINSNKKGNYAFIHNHNTPTEFSERDLQTLLGDNSVNMFVISRYDGKCFILEPNGKIPDTLTFDLLYKNEIKIINQKLRDGLITAGERTYQRERMLVDNVIRDYTKGVKKFG